MKRHEVRALQQKQETRWSILNAALGKDHSQQVQQLLQELGSAAGDVSKLLRVVEDYEFLLQQDNSESLQDSAMEKACEVETASQLRSLWDEAKAHWTACADDDLARLCHRYYLRNSLSLKGWQDGPGRLAGVVPTELVEKVFCPGSWRNGRNPSRGRTFKGRKWSDVLVTPFYKTAKEICGFLFVGRQQNKLTSVFRTLKRRGPRTGAYEAGLAWLPEALATLETVVAVADPLLALRLHVRHANMHRDLLPLTAWYTGAEAHTRTAWQAASGAEIVLWASEFDHHVLFQSYQSKGRVSLGSFDVDASPYDIYRRLIRRAVAWEVALDRWVAAHNNREVLDLLIDTKKDYKVEPVELIAVCSKQDRLRGLLTRNPE